LSSVRRDKNSSISPRSSVGSQTVSRLSRIKRLGEAVPRNWTTAWVRSLLGLSHRWAPTSAASSTLLVAESQATKCRWWV
jgi:hypothetical protein